jgi:hypothetical protein
VERLLADVVSVFFGLREVGLVFAQDLWLVIVHGDCATVAMVGLKEGNGGVEELERTRVTICRNRQKAKKIANNILSVCDRYLSGALLFSLSLSHTHGCR